MILIDTSVWINHLCSNNKLLTALLASERVLIHPFVIGEVALGSLRQRKLILTTLSNLPFINVATDSEVFRFIERYTLFGQGIGYIDAHLLAAVRLTPGASLWTDDKKLHDVANKLHIATKLKIKNRRPTDYVAQLNRWTTFI